MSLKERLIARARSKGPIRVGLVGAGQMGTGLISQMERMEGMRVVAVADIVPGRAKEAYLESNVPDRLVASLDDNPQKAAELIEEGFRISTTSADLLTQIDVLDVVLECTGIRKLAHRSATLQSRTASMWSA